MNNMIDNNEEAMLVGYVRKSSQKAALIRW